MARGGHAEVDRAVAAARSAFDTWGRTSAADRAKVLHRVAELVEERVPELAPVETRDNGSLLRSHLNSVMPRVARNFRFFADQLTELGDEAFEMNEFVSRTEWDPSGVTVVITPWNAPLMLATWRIAPALAAGNSVVAKPPEWAPLSASILADLTREAGLPDGAFNVVQGIGEEAGAALTRHPGVDRIAFTGSIETGKLVAQAAAANLTPTSLELGGKSPFVAFADADLDAVVKQAVNQFDNAGQVCLAGTRLIVERSMDDAFLERFLQAAAAIRQGDPREETTDIGPLITREHFERVDGFVQRAKADGATVLLGGGPNEDLGGLYYRPTLFGDVPEGAEVLRKEVFGPGPHAPDVRGRGGGDRARERDRLRAGRDRVHGRPRTRRTRLGARGRRHGLGEQLLRARPSGAVRRREVLGGRPRGRRLQLRLLRGRQERLHGTLGGMTDG